MVPYAFPRGRADALEIINAELKKGQNMSTTPKTRIKQCGSGLNALFGVEGARQCYTAATRAFSGIVGREPITCLDVFSFYEPRFWFGFEEPVLSRRSCSHCSRKRRRHGSRVAVVTVCSTLDPQPSSHQTLFSRKGCKRNILTTYSCDTEPHLYWTLLSSWGA